MKCQIVTIGIVKYSRDLVYKFQITSDLPNNLPANYKTRGILDNPGYHYLLLAMPNNDKMKLETHFETF